MLAKTAVAFALVLSASALTVPHHGHSGHRRALANRAPVAEPQPVPVPVVVPKRRRSLNKRCAVNSTLSASATSVSDFSSSSSAFSASVATSALTSVPVSSSYSAEPSSSGIVNLASQIPTDLSSWVAPTSSVESSTWEDSTTWVAPTSSYVEPTPTYVAPTTEWSSPAPAPTTAAPSGNGPSWLYGTQDGDGTYYDAGLGACGITNTNSDYIVAVSHDLFDQYPDYNGVNPNTNPICNKQIIASYAGKSVTLTITDRCEACSVTSIDLTPTAFSQLADLSVGRIDLTWVWA